MCVCRCVGLGRRQSRYVSGVSGGGKGGDLASRSEYSQVINTATHTHTHTQPRQSANHSQTAVCVQLLGGCLHVFSPPKVVLMPHACGLCFDAGPADRIQSMGDPLPGEQRVYVWTRC